MSWLEREFEHAEILRDAAARCVVVVVLHSTRPGPAFGGIRRWSYPNVEAAGADAWRLAEAMTAKCALAGVPGGGGKVALIDHPRLDRAAAYEVIGAAVERLGGRFFTGPDVGTEPADLTCVARRTGYVTRPEVVGDLAEPTAHGVFAGIGAVLERLDREWSGATIAVQGLGAVGMRLASRLISAGARVLATDVDAERLARAVRELGVVPLALDAIVAVECDVFAPCALGGVIDAGTVPRLRARAVAGAANNVLATAADGRALWQRGILYAPDCVINAGALLHGALHHLEGAPASPERIATIGARVGAILDRARAEDVPPEVIAECVARERLAESAMARRQP